MHVLEKRPQGKSSPTSIFFCYILYFLIFCACVYYKSACERKDPQPMVLTFFLFLYFLYAYYDHAGETRHKHETTQQKVNDRWQELDTPAAQTDGRTASLRLVRLARPHNDGDNVSYGI